jgi:deazaflavin-dependent oxidoreductase (nitroreductase family)
MALGEFRKALEGTDEVELTVTGRTSGRTSSRPVWFVQEGTTLYLLPVKGSDSDWYKNVLKTPTISLAAKGARWSATATPITEAAKVRDVVEKFRAKYGTGEVKKYYSKLDVAVAVPLDTSR